MACQVCWHGCLVDDLKRQACLCTKSYILGWLTKQDRHVYVMSSDHGNSDGGGTGDIGSDEYSHYKAL